MSLRMLARNLLLAVAVSPLIVPSSAAQTEKVVRDDASVRIQVKESEALLGALERARRLGIELDSVQLEATGVDPQVLLETADARSRLTAELTRDQAEELYRANVQVYTEAARSGSPREAALARNELGNLHLSMNQPARAIEAFAAIDLDAVPEEQRFVYRFNRARAYEAVGASSDAWQDYLTALGAQPTFRAALDGASRLLVQAPADDRGAARQAAELAGLLLEEGQLAALEEVLWPALEKWGTPELLALLACRWAVAPPEGGALADGAKARLIRLATAGAAPRPLVSGLLGAFDDRHFERLAAQLASSGVAAVDELLAPFRPWQDAGEAAAVSALLTGLAAEDHRRGALAAALARGFVAWRLDRGNTDAAVRVAAVLRSAPGLDPQGRLLDQLIGDLFAVKGDAYARRDWRNILRMHLLLATVFEERGEWGSEGEVRSALFHLERAVWAEERVRELDPTVPPSPGLHRRLADGYAAVGELERSFDHRLLAARGLADVDRLDDARAELTAAAGVPLPATGERRQRLDRAAARLGVAPDEEEADRP